MRWRPTELDGKPNRNDQKNGVRREKSCICRQPVSGERIFLLINQSMGYNPRKVVQGGRCKGRELNDELYVESERGLPTKHCATTTREKAQ